MVLPIIVGDSEILHASETNVSAVDFSFVVGRESSLRGSV